CAARLGGNLCHEFHIEPLTASHLLRFFNTHRSRRYGADDESQRSTGAIFHSREDSDSRAGSLLRRPGRELDISTFEIGSRRNKYRCYKLVWFQCSLTAAAHKGGHFDLPPCRP